MGNLLHLLPNVESNRDDDNGGNIDARCSKVGTLHRQEKQSGKERSIPRHESVNEVPSEGSYKYTGHAQETEQANDETLIGGIGKNIP